MSYESTELYLGPKRKPAKDDEGIPYIIDTRYLYLCLYLTCIMLFLGLCKDRKRAANTGGIYLEPKRKQPMEDMYNEAYEGTLLYGA